MKELWRLISLVVCLAGFVVVAAILVVQDEGLFTVALKAIAAFFALWVIQGVLRAFVGLGVRPLSHADDSEVGET